MYLSDMFVESPENIDYLTGLGVDDSGLINVDSSVVSVPVQDVTDKFVTNEDLPKGDFRINPAAGIDAPVETLDYGKIVSGLSSIFDDSSANPFSSALTDVINDEMNDAVMEYLTNEF